MTIPKLYIGAMNDTCFIIDVPPRPAPMDDHNDSLPAPTICVNVGPTREDQRRAEIAVRAWNTAFELT